MKQLLTFLILALLMSSCFAVLEEGKIKVFAVTDNGGAMSADLSVDLKQGSGKVWTSVEPLVGTSTQSTEKIAIQVAHDYSNEVDDYDYFFNIKSNASLVEGPSAGAAMALIVISALQDKEVPDNVALTGTITAEGGVGPVGGVFEKSKEAARIGIELFMIPPGESRQTVKIDDEVVSVNLADYAEKNWGLKVVEVDNIAEVLEYAYSDIGSIDINASDLNVVEFVPDPIYLDESLYPMRDITRKYITEAEDAIRSAKTSLSGTMLNDPSLVDALLTNLNESEKLLDESKILFDQNYLYSSANFSFLAMANASFVKDIAENPTLLSRASTAFRGKVDSLSSEMDSFEYDLNQFVPIDFFEWHVASKERFTWAKLKINQIKEADSGLVITMEDGVDWDRVSEIMDYEYAVAWFKVSKDFFELTKPSKKAFLPDAGPMGLVDSYVANAENGLTALGEDDVEDISRRIESAKIAVKNGWTYSALFDSSSAFSLVNSKIFSKNRNLEELQSALGEKMVALEDKIYESSQSHVWARLYLDHARYYMDSSLFYESQGQTGLALNSAQAGVDLAFLADASFNAAEESRAHFSSLPASRLIDVSPGWQERPLLNDLVFALVIAFVLLTVMMVLAIALSGKKFHLLKPFSFEDMFDDALLEQRRLRQRLEKGYISQEDFEQLEKPIHERISKMLAERRALSSDYVELELNKCKVIAFERALRDLKSQYQKKQVTLQDFKLNNSFYTKKISLLKHLIGEAQKKIVFDKKKAAETFYEKTPAMKNSPGKRTSKKPTSPAKSVPGKPPGEIARQNAKKA